MLIVFTK